VRFCVLVNLYRPDAVQAARAVTGWLVAKGHSVITERESESELGVPGAPTESLADVDLMVTFGGDGTLIRAAHLCSVTGTPILGVYYGRFGFVTQCSPGETGAAISQFIDRQATIEERMMIQTELVRENKVVATLHSLNEAVVQRSATTRMLTFEVQVNGKPLARYPADGVLVSTPTGSTAYALSAGGPIIDPSLEALLLAAVMPHTLSTRPLVLDASAVIEISIETRGDAVLSCDGQSRLHLLSGDHVRITRSARSTRLVSVDDGDFLDKLSSRLSWSQGRMEDEG
jgi:NAD+ kinase